ncbi:hypothetical protein [Klebsiella quasipneumoniae]|uniref:hypothetical protein n=1 Tax=Klebsiella quasipneumoniae TaxID=1463165 RepID=UPI002180D9EB|nr:hypothetical protein [Klebsiella quasipneumoniae]GKP06837.1 hypothetical protein NUKP2_28340 [Klebsiella quasipneumoniae]HCI9117925.1 hypothetical protein [Klebsiella quasipneumoniae]
MKMSDTLNKSISFFCKNNFTDNEENHCAHFVCHVLQIDTGYDCKLFMNGQYPGACLRVHELFAACPAVGEWEHAPTGLKIAFITDSFNVDLESHKMRNVPKKHVGIFSNGLIYHYSNIQDMVICQSAEDFMNRFKKTYGGNLKLYYGIIPPSAILPDSESDTNNEGVSLQNFVSVSKGTEPIIRKEKVSDKQNDYYATFEGSQEFYIARSVRYKSFKGLYQPHNKKNGPRYLVKDYIKEYGTMAGVIAVISQSESEGYFNTLNTYDRASFTFGFFQFAAHTPDDNLILLIRRAAREHEMFKTNFPELVLVDGVLHRDLGLHSVSLERKYPRTGNSEELILKDFMSYLNPNVTDIDDKELSNAAKLIQLANTNITFNHLQVNVAAQITMRKIRERYNIWYKLNGASDLICTAIADIHHQGRGTRKEISGILTSKLSSDEQLKALCLVGIENNLERCKSLSLALDKAKEDGYLGVSRFDSASGLFKPNQGWPE